MNFDFILLIILFSYFRKTLKSKVLLPKIDFYLLIGFWLSIALLLIGTSIYTKFNPLDWVAHAMLIAILYVSLTKIEFKPVKSVAYAILPLVIVNFLYDALKLISSKFHAEWENYLDIAVLFSYIWLFAMFLINKKQRKDIEQEQLKAIQREKEFQQSELLKAKLEIQVLERTAELQGQKEELQKTLNELKSTQAQLIQSEKMASLGELTAGIAHEIQNPLNFVNNFSEVSCELLVEMDEELEKGDVNEAKVILTDIKLNLEKINHHGKRADAIVKGMLAHSRLSSGEKVPTDINALADEYLRLSYHGLRAKDKSFNADFKTNFDPNLPLVNVIPQDIGRVFLNLINNAFQAINGVENPKVTVETQLNEEGVQISISDNGPGISEDIKDKIFQPFFTTKPAGQGTGLGLSLSYDIVKAHGGILKVHSKINEGTKFIIIFAN